jgi:hypothetical protein
MLAPDGFLSNNDGRLAPIRPDASQGYPRQLVTRLQARATVRPLHRHQLLPKRQVLQEQFSMDTESQRQRPTDDDQQLEHVPILAGARQNQLEEFWRGSVVSHCLTANGRAETASVHLDETGTGARIPAHEEWSCR